MPNTERKCIVTGKKIEISKMIRIVRTKDGKFLVDSNENGRGAYVTNDPKHASDIVLRKVLHKAFKEQVSKEVYDELIKTIKEK